MILLRASPHCNGIFTFLDNRNVIKSTSDRSSVKRLEAEIFGYEWYVQNLGKVNSILSSNFPQTLRNSQGIYIRIQIPFVEGIIRPYYLSIAQNFCFLDKVFDFYTNKWPKTSDLCAVHGDFSLGNLIWSNSDDFTIIDWEHFHECFAPWGFDLINLVYESVFFSMNDGNLGDHSRKVLVYFKEKYERHSPVNAMKFDLKTLVDFMKNNREHWGTSFHKFPVLELDKFDIND